MRRSLLDRLRYRKSGRPLRRIRVKWEESALLRQLRDGWSGALQIQSGIVVMPIPRIELGRSISTLPSTKSRHSEAFVENEIT